MDLILRFFLIAKVMVVFFKWRGSRSLFPNVVSVGECFSLELVMHFYSL